MLYDPYQGTGIGEIAMVQNEVTTTGVWVLVEMINSIGVEQRSTAFDAMNFITFFNKNSARYAPSCPVTPVIKAFFIGCFIKL